MRTTLIRQRFHSPFVQFVLAHGVFVGTVDAADDDAYLAARRKAAQQVLDERHAARVAAGWTPPSKDEQMMTRLSRHRDLLVRIQELAKTRATFEAARAEVYIDLARRYSQIGYYRRGYARTYVRGVGAYGPVVYATDYWVMDPLAARLSAYFGEKAAKSKGIAAAQEFHANTYYERRIQTTNMRVAALQNQIRLKSQLADKEP